MRKVRFSCVLTTILTSTYAHSNIKSTFDADSEGWLGVRVNPLTFAVEGAWSPTWSAGTIVTDEVSGGLFLLAAPSKFLGDQSEYFGGTLSFRLASRTNDGVVYPTVILRGAGSVLYHTASAPTTSLSKYAFDLTPSSWKTALGTTPTEAVFKSTLASLDAFGINGDWTTGTLDRVTLDDVELAAPVPEPATLAAMGTAALAVRRRYRPTRRNSAQ